MTFNDSIRTNPTRAKSSRGRGGMVAGGGLGLGGVVLFVLYMLMGGDPSDLPQPAPPPGPQSGVAEQDQTDKLAKCTDGEAANTYAECRVIATAESLDAVWGELLPREAGREDVKAGLHIFEDAVNTGCGAASSSTGPFFCPADDTVYIDTRFYDALETQLGAKNAPLAQSYIIAHEWGHHIQHLTGQSRQVNHSDTGPASSMVRMELQADCYAGIWVHHAAQSVDPESGETFMKPPTPEQINDALTAAAAVGDDRIQEKAGHIAPESWTHGSAKQRTTWFTRGYEHGTMKACDTWSVDHP
ncbi:MAG: neutral zinc metallopeptidase [Bowdeniella nasicola]|nr:neutral zinc metallopeptidase [Bowdeniella nasicola]